MKLHVFTHLRPSFSPARLAVTVVFFINGFVFSNWVPRIPAIQQQLGLSTGMLGLALSRSWREAFSSEEKKWDRWKKEEL